MCPARCVLVLLSVLGFVVGIVNSYNFNKPTTDSKLELEDYINKILIKWENKFLDKIITYIDSKIETVNNKLIQTLNLSNQNIEKKIDETIRANESNNKKYNMLEVKILETMNTLDSVKKELLEINRTLTNISCGKLPPLPHGSFELLNGTTNLGSVVQYSCATNYRLVGPTQRMCAEDFQWSETAPSCEVDCGKLPLLPHGSAELLNGTTHLGSVVQYSCATNYRLVGPARRTCAEDFQWSETAPTCEGLCKEQTVAKYGVTPDYLLDAVSLHYGTLRRDSAGRRAHFELHFALQTDGRVDFDLSEKEDYSGIRYSLLVGVDSHQRTRLLYNGNRVQDISTPDILSATEFRWYYIKVEDGKLQFGKEGDPPLISHSGVNLNTLNFYRFDTWRRQTSIRFCPAAVEGSS